MKHNIDVVFWNEMVHELDEIAKLEHVEIQLINVYAKVFNKYKEIVFDAKVSKAYFIKNGSPFKLIPK